MAFEVTIPTDPASPCKNRKQISQSIFGANAIKKEERAKTIKLIKVGIRRPILSDKGPIKICPIARPIKQVVIVNWAKEAVVWSCFCISGSDEAYISSDKGPKADRVPRIKIIHIFLALVKIKSLFLNRIYSKLFYRILFD